MKPKTLFKKHFYGDGTKDNKATATVNVVTKEFTLKKINSKVLIQKRSVDSFRQASFKFKQMIYSFISSIYCLSEFTLSSGVKI